MSSLTPIELPPEELEAKKKEINLAAKAYIASCARGECLAKINSVLETFNVPRWTDANLGFVNEGQCEVIDMLDMEEIVKGKRVRLTLLVRLPTGSSTSVKVNFGGQIVYVVPYLQMPAPRRGEPVNEVYLVKRWRIETGGWSYELPHGLVFIDGKKEPDAFNTPAHEILTRSFGEEAVLKFTAAHVYPLGHLTLKGENARADTYVLAASIRFTFKKRKGDCEIVRLTLKQCISLIKKGEQITDVNTVATLLRAAEKFDIR
ncbi:hypothetical protein ACFLZO_00935 [Patescibacteria group bacterium]